MKLTSKPTDCIILKADTNSEWDSVDFVLLRIRGKEWAEWVTPFIELANQFPVGTGFYNISLWCSPDGWYQLGFNDAEDNFLEDLSEKEWSYVELEEGEEESFTPPENKIRTDQLKIFHGGTARFLAYGEYTGEEFWTEDFPLKQILEKYNELVSI